jgi:hypothetical protein
MFRSGSGGGALALFLAGCSILAPRDPDLTPVNRTAVLETRAINSGTQDFPAFESTTLSYTRANMQRTETSVNSSGPISQFLDLEAKVRIERLDRKLAWTLDAKNKRVTECPLKGCPASSPKKRTTKKSADEDKPGDSTCRLRIGNSVLTAEPTGQKRRINGFDAEQYDIKWMVTFRDNASRKSTSTVSIDLWTTPVTPAMAEAKALERAYVLARDNILGIDTVKERMGILPPEAGKMISGYLSANVGPTDRANFLAGAKKPDEVKGQPISMKVKWSFAGEACSMAGTMKDIGDKPLFTFTLEVNSHTMEPLHDSLFEAPKGYKITK